MPGWYLGLGSPLCRLPTSLLTCSKARLLQWAGLGGSGGSPGLSLSQCHQFASSRGQVAELRWPTEGSTVPGPAPFPAGQWSLGRRVPVPPRCSICDYAYTIDPAPPECSASVKFWLIECSGTWKQSQKSFLFLLWLLKAIRSSI